jgi:flagellar basal-body rod protein FlgG
MDPAIYDAIRGCLIQQATFDMVANNLANTGTTGFKKDFLFLDEAQEVNAKSIMAQGNIRHTGNPLNLALAGEGFFKVDTPNGIRYTRNGSFYLNAQGGLITSNGDPVLGTGGPVSIEGTDITIDTTGRIEVDGTEVDTLAIVSFEQPENLQKEGDSYYVYVGDANEEPQPTETSVQQGYLEESNVMVTEEMIRMVEALRNFESYVKVLQTFDEVNAEVINEVGKL